MKKSIKESNLVILKNSSIHHKGIFAKKAIQAETKVLQYIGEKISKQEGTKRAIAAIEKESESKGGVYIFELNDKHDIDGDVPYNLAKYINHSCTPNCKILKEKGQIWIQAIKNIETEEELTYNYGYDLEEFKDHPCKCGSERCVGFIVDEKLWYELGKLKTKHNLY